MKTTLTPEQILARETIVSEWKYTDPLCRVTDALSAINAYHEQFTPVWDIVDAEADVKDTNLLHFQEYFIVLAENGKVTRAVFCDWDTEGMDNTWIINDQEFPLSLATHYQEVVYPQPPKD